jgi:primosomal protein N'
MEYTVPMRIVSAVPILRGVAPDILSYYTGLKVEPGSLIEVPIRKKFAPALVVAVTDVKEASSDIRRAAYKLKKVKRVISVSALPAAVITTAEHLSHFYAAPLGSVLYSVIPQHLFSAPNFLDILSALPLRIKDDTFPMPPRILQLPYDERLARYRSIIRESFSQRKSTIVIAPTRAEAEDLFNKLSKGVEDHAYLLVSTLTPKQQRAKWEEAMTDSDPVLVVGTMFAGSVWRVDLAHYIIDHESSPYYKSAERPFIDNRHALMTLARMMRIDCVFGDTYLRMETIAKTFDHTYEEMLRLQMHQQTNAAVTLVDMREVPHDRGESPVLSPQANDAIIRSINDGERTFIYTTRKGHTPLTLCRDCGTVLVCDKCDAPMVLHTKKGVKEEVERWFECHRCGRTRDAETICEVCGGWRLYAYGFGIEKVHEVVKGYKKSAPVFLLSGDTAKTHYEAMKIITTWGESKNGILVGTARALPYLRFAPPATSILAAFETLLMLPDIYMQERLFDLLSYMREITGKRLLVQTRTPEHETLKLAIAGDGNAFFKAEDERRKSFLYPPYGLQIKITLQGKQADVIAHLNGLKSLLLPYAVAVYPAFISKVKGRFTAHALVTMPVNEWPNTAIEDALRALPPAYRIDINPESLL